MPLTLESHCRLHLFEDRVMKMSYVRVGPNSTIGERSVVLYDSEMKAGARLGNLSLLIKGEVLAEGSEWERSPVRSRCYELKLFCLRRAKSKRHMVVQPTQSLKHLGSLSKNPSHGRCV